MMERRPLGATGVEVPVVEMGTWRTFDVRGREAEARCRAVLDEAYAAGATLWTADDAEAKRQATNALRWYGGRVDIYQVHNLLRLDDRLAQLRRMRDEGTVRVIGATHYQHAAFPALLALVKSRAVDQIQMH